MVQVVEQRGRKPEARGPPPCIEALSCPGLPCLLLLQEVVAALSAPRKPPRAPRQAGPGSRTGPEELLLASVTSPGARRRRLPFHASSSLEAGGHPLFCGLTVTPQRARRAQAPHTSSMKSASPQLLLILAPHPQGVLWPQDAQLLVNRLYKVPRRLASAYHRCVRVFQANCKSFCVIVALLCLWSSTFVRILV